ATLHTIEVESSGSKILQIPAFSRTLSRSRQRQRPHSSTNNIRFISHVFSIISYKSFTCFHMFSYLYTAPLHSPLTSYLYYLYVHTALLHSLVMTSYPEAILFSYLLV